MAKIDIDNEYIGQANALETEYFKIVSEYEGEGHKRKRIGQHRELRAGKVLNEFEVLHSLIWTNHEVELIAKGFMEARVAPEPARNLASELDELKARIKALEGKTLLL